MLRLQLEVYNGKEYIDLGELHVVRRPGEYAEDLGNYDVKLAGSVVGVVENFERKLGAWKLTQLALSSVYGESIGELLGDHRPDYPKKRIKPYRFDGRCNGLTKRGQRCTMEAAQDSPFCLTHTWQSSYP